MIKIDTTVVKIRKKLKQITNRLSELIKNVPIEYLNNSNSSLVIINRPEYYWGEPSKEQMSTQMGLKKEYDKIFELLNLIFRKAPNGILVKLEQADKQFRMWLQLESNWYLSNNRDDNEKRLRVDVKELEKLLDILDTRKSSELILIPDTNSLLIYADPIKYRNVINKEKFTFLLLPTVLSELDKLKIFYRNLEIQERAKKVIARIKGWRNQGSLSLGVKVDQTITVKAIANEPNMNSTLSWLDSDNADDRIIANVLEIQVCYPATRVVLITGDINLQNKAEVAMIEFNEIEILSKE